MYFYIVDLSCKNEDESLKVKLNIRIPNESIKNFDVDFNMATIILTTNCGKSYIFDLPKALENEKILSKRKVELGVERNLVYTFLEKVESSELQFN